MSERLSGFPRADRPAELSYEETLESLQALVGRQVVVTIADLSTFLLTATFTGELHSAMSGEEIDAVMPGAWDDELDDDELVAFVVGSRESVGAGFAATFAVWKARFETGLRLTVEDGGEGVAFVVGEARTQVVLA